MDSPLKRLRERTGLSAYAFAREAGIASQYMYVLEADSSNMQTKTAVNLARTLARHLDKSPTAVLAELLEVEDERILS